MYLPINLNIKNKNILIIGGGQVALQKLETLTKFTNNITVVATEIISEIKNLDIKFLEQQYNASDLENVNLVYACTNNRELNQQIKKEANTLEILVNVADDPELCDFISPAVHKGQEYVVAVSSNGKNVRGAIALRDKIKELNN